MALRGLGLTTWLGWLFGVISIKHPTGPPLPASGISYSTIVFAISAIFSIYTYIDNTIFTPGAANLNQRNYLGRVITFANIQQVIYFAYFLRAYYFFYRKELVYLMNHLYFQTLSLPQDPWYKRFFKPGHFRQHLGLLTSVTGSCAGLTISLPFLSKFSWLGRVASPILYQIFFVAFSITPSWFAESAAHNIPTVFTEIMGDMFDSFVRDAKGTILSLKRSQYQVAAKINPEPIMLSCMKNDVIVRFEKIRDIFERAQKFLSPLIFCTIFTGTFGFITAVSRLVVLKQGELMIALGVLKIVHSWCLIGLCESGEEINRKVRRGQQEIYSAFVSLPSDIEGKAELEDVINSIRTWNWRLSAGGFFTVSRKLVIGVGSLILTYVVIFFQLYASMFPMSVRECE